MCVLYTQRPECKFFLPGKCTNFHDVIKMTAAGIELGTFTLKVHMVYLYFCSHNANFKPPSSDSSTAFLSGLSAISSRPENASIFTMRKKCQLPELNPPPFASSGCSPTKSSLGHNSSFCATYPGPFGPHAPGTLENGASKNHFYG